ncbi:arylsulfatase [Puniceicoccaceae bacterium K14]|nr:arylsulfatase [Puniceicoccaceae bacterium K14]
MKNFGDIVVLTVALILGLAPTSARETADGSSKALRQVPDRPNVIIVMTDDQGYGDISFYGNPLIETPALDRLASESVRLEDFHVAPMCAPTRGQLLTGLDAARNGTINVSSGRCLMRPELETMADTFQKNDYVTGLFGKWHLGDNYPYRPEDRGFQETVWFPSSHIGSVPDYWGNDYVDDVYIHNGVREEYEGYCANIFFDRAMEWMSASAKANKPFFAYLPTNTPHWPHVGEEDDEERIREILARSEYRDWPEGRKNQFTGFLAMILNIDRNMKRLREFLKREELEENTILIFTTDNGSTWGPQYFNAGMSGKKTQLLEGGHRVPCFISWPQGDLAVGKEVKGLTHIQDFFPTLLELCEMEGPDSVVFDGMSLVPFLKGEDEAPGDRMLIVNYSRLPQGFDYPSPNSPAIMKREGAGVLWKRWRLLEDRELYDLESDPLQKANVIDRFPEVATKMRSRLYDWWDDVKDLANEPQRVIIGSDQENPMMITSCEWMDVFVDMQVQIKRGVHKNSYMFLTVDQPGEYEFELRRWPRERDLALSEAGEGEVALPITRARLFIGRENVYEKDKQAFSFKGETSELAAGDKFATFQVSLDAGPITLHTWFDDEYDNSLCGAYYVYVKRL